jgi:hypothetical protein
MGDLRVLLVDLSFYSRLARRCRQWRNVAPYVQVVD